MVKLADFLYLLMNILNMKWATEIRKQAKQDKHECGQQINFIKLFDTHKVKLSMIKRDEAEEIIILNDERPKKKRGQKTRPKAKHDGVLRIHLPQ